MSSFIDCDENDDVTMRGRMPAHDVQRYRKMLLDSLLVKRRKHLLRHNMCSNKSNVLIKRSSMTMDIMLFQSLCYQNYSYDKNTRPYAHYELPTLSCNDSFNQMSKHDFCLTRMCFSEEKKGLC